MNKEYYKPQRIRRRKKSYKADLLELYQSSEGTRKARRSQTKFLQTLKDHGCQSKLPYPRKLSIIIDGESKIFYNRIKFKQFQSTNLIQQKALEKTSNLGKLAVPTKKVQDNLIPTKLKEWKHTQYHHYHHQIQKIRMS